MTFLVNYVSMDTIFASGIVQTAEKHTQWRYVMREHGVADHSQTAMTQERGARETHSTLSMIRNRRVLQKISNKGNAFFPHPRFISQWILCHVHNKRAFSSDHLNLHHQKSFCKNCYDHHKDWVHQHHEGKAFHLSFIICYIYDIIFGLWRCTAHCPLELCTS